MAFIFSGLKLPMVIFCWINRNSIQLLIKFDILSLRKGVIVWHGIGGQ